MFYFYFTRVSEPYIHNPFGGRGVDGDGGGNLVCARVSVRAHMCVTLMHVSPRSVRFPDLFPPMSRVKKTSVAAVCFQTQS